MNEKEKTVIEREGISYTRYEGVEVSKSKDAEELVGMRNEEHPGANPLFEPCELGYECPICGASDEVNLLWSEYHSFIWCKKCNLDIPSCLCVKYKGWQESELSPRQRVEKATETFLLSIRDALERKKVEK